MSSCEFTKLLPKHANIESWKRYNPCSTPDLENTYGISLCTTHAGQYQRGFFDNLINKPISILERVLKKERAPFIISINFKTILDSKIS